MYTVAGSIISLLRIWKLGL